jgi:DNA-binding NtrC family response regulator
MAGEPSRVLVVEDDPQLARLYARALSAAGHLVDTAHDGHEGLKTLLAGSYDLVLSDIAMPRMGGMELLEKARVLRPDVPFVLITAQLDADLYSRARGMGIVRYLLKPVGLHQLVNAVDTGLKIRALTLRNQRRKGETRANRRP